MIVLCYQNIKFGNIENCDGRIAFVNPKFGTSKTHVLSLTMSSLNSVNDEKECVVIALLNLKFGIVEMSCLFLHVPT